MSGHHYAKIEKSAVESIFRAASPLFLLLFSLITAVCMFQPAEASAATYYVSPAGSDTASGSATAPFKSIQKAANIVNPGDTVIVKDGVYTDLDNDGNVVYSTRGGTATNWVTFRSENKWGAVLDGKNFTTLTGWPIQNAGYIRIEGFDFRYLKGGNLHAGTGAHDVYFYGNKVHDSGRVQVPCDAPSVAGQGCGAYVATTAYNITYDSNIFYNLGRLPGGCATYDYNQDHGIYLKGDNSTVVNNIFYEVKAGWGIQLIGTDAQNAVIANNTFYGANPGRTGHVLLNGTCTNITIENNISHTPNSVFVRTSTPSDDTNITVRNNLVYGAALSDPVGSSYTVSGNIVGQDPKFVNLNSHDFHLQSASPAIDKGLDLGLQFDAEGNPVVGLPDLGALEYTAAADTASPSIPSGLTAKAVSASQINLSWAASTDNVAAAGYKVYRNGTQVATTSNTSYSNTGLAASTTYSYTVAAYDAAGNTSGQSAAVSATTLSATDTQAPSVPAGLKAAVLSTSQISLSWTASTDNTGVAGYKVYRNGSLIAAVIQTTYQDSGLLASTTYSYSVAAYDAAGNTSGQSAAVSAATQAAPDTLAPSVPLNLKAAAVSSSQVNLSWTASTDNVAVTGYRVYRNGVQLGVTVSNTYTDSTLNPSTAYSYAVSAFDAAGNVSASSGAVSATTLTGDVILDNGMTGTSFTGSWSASSGANPYGAGSLWGSKGATYTWKTGLKSGTYNVYMWWTAYPDRNTKAPVTISYSRGSKKVSVNQQVNGGKWNLIGTFYFDAATGATVKLSSSLSSTVTSCADAVRFEFVK